MQSDDTQKKLSHIDRDLIERRIYELADLRARGDMAGMMRYAAPDIVIKCGVHRDYPFHACREGKDAAGDLGQAVNIAYENLGSEITSLLIDGDRVALHRTATIRNRGTGKSIKIDICNFLRFRDGLVDEFSEYADTAAFARLDMQEI